MSAVRKPEVTATLTGGNRTVADATERLLVVGQNDGTGTAASGALIENIGNDGAWDTLFGERSPLAYALRRIRSVNSETYISAIGLDAALGANQASGTIEVSGDATSDGYVEVAVNSQRFSTYTVAVDNGDTAETIAEGIVAAINADPQALVTATSLLGVVTVTASVAGAFGNDIPIKVVALTATGTNIFLTELSGGGVDPSLTGVLDVVGETRYAGVAWQFESDPDTVADWLDARFNAQNVELDGRAMVTAVGTYAELLTKLQSENSKSLVYGVNRLLDTNTQQGGSIVEHPFGITSDFMAVRALRRTPGAIISDYVVSQNTLDQFGGVHTNTKPYFNTPMVYLDVEDAVNAWTTEEQDAIEEAGGALFGSNAARTGVIAGAVPTTYKTDADGNPDQTYATLNNVDAETAYRGYIATATRVNYPQFRATGGALQPNYDMTNVPDVAAFVAEQNQIMGRQAVSMIGVGSNDGQPVDYDQLFRESLAVTYDPSLGAFTVGLTYYPVLQARSWAYGIRIEFTTGA